MRKIDGVRVTIRESDGVNVQKEKEGWGKSSP